MRVVFLDSVVLDYGGGYESWVRDAVHFGVELGYDVTAVTPCRWIASMTSALAGVRRGAVSASNEPWPLEQRAGWRRARRILSLADVVYVKNEPHELLFALLATRPLVPVVVGVHSSIDRPGDALGSFRERLYRSLLYRRMLGSATVVHALNQAQAELLVSELGLAAQSVAVAPNGVDTARFVPAAPTDPDGGPFRVLFAGRLDRQKGVDVVCDAVALMEVRYPGLRIEVTIAGEGPLDGMVRTAAARSNRLRPVGRVDDMASLYRHHHLVVAPSRWEVFALVPAEALSSGVPLVLSDIPAAQTFLSGATSFCEPNSASSLAKAILASYYEWSENKVYRRRQADARAYALAHLDAKQCFTRVYGLLTEAARA